MGSQICTVPLLLPETITSRSPTRPSATDPTTMVWLAATTVWLAQPDKQVAMLLAARGLRNGGVPDLCVQAPPHASHELQSMAGVTTVRPRFDPSRGGWCCTWV